MAFKISSVKVCRSKMMPMTIDVILVHANDSI